MVKKKITRKKKATKKNVVEPYFIGINSPIELRKNLLEPTREVIQFLQSYEQFKRTKEEKTYMISQLKEDLKQIKQSIGVLKRLLPKSKIKSEHTYNRIRQEIAIEQRATAPEPVMPSAPPASVEPQQQPVPVVANHSELDLLEKDLNDIEKKLGTLSE